jgi:thiol-disulfide isomerase/thioredoxin
MKKIIAIFIVLLIAFIAVIFIFGKTDIKPYKAVVPHQFAESNFNKDYYSSDDLLLISVWATWCGPCIKEFPVLEKVSDDNKKLKFVSISIDDDTIKLKKFLLKNDKLNSRDITLKNFNFRDSIYRKIKFIDSYMDNSFVKFNSKEVPYLVLMKNKQILYQAHDKLDVKLLQSIISQNITP